MPEIVGLRAAWRTLEKGDGGGRNILNSADKGSRLFRLVRRGGYKVPTNHFVASGFDKTTTMRASSPGCNARGRRGVLQPAKHPELGWAHHPGP